MRKSAKGTAAVLSVLALAQLIIVLDGTIVAIALPQIQRELSFSLASLQWVVNAYALAFGGALLTAGRLADRFGRARTLVVGLVLFSLASAIGGAAQSAVWLVVARAAQGLFAAMIAPAALGLLTSTFVETRARARAFAVYGSIGTLGAGVGLVLGGLLTTYLNWRWTMYVNVPLGLANALLVLVLVPRKEAHVVSGRLDVPGAVLATGGVTLLVFGFVRSAESGWDSVDTLALLAGSIVCLFLLVVVERRVSDPLLSARVMGSVSRVACFAVGVLAGAGVLGMFFFISQFMQVVKGYSALTTGFAFVPNIVAVAVAGRVAEALLHRVGARHILTGGLLLSSIGVAMLGFLVRPSSGFVTQILPGNLVLCIGIGLTFVTLANATLEGVDHADAGVASALFTACQQVGGAAGLALFASVAASVVADRGSSPGDHAAITAGYDAGFFVSALFFLLAAIVVAALVRTDKRSVDEEAHAMVLL